MRPGFDAVCPACGHPRRCEDPSDLIAPSESAGARPGGWYLPCGYCPELIPIPARKVNAAWSKTALAASQRIRELRLAYRARVKNIKPDTGNAPSHPRSKQP